MEMTRLSAGGFGDLPELDAIIAHEPTDYGWRGLTALGEVLEVRSRNGHKATAPDEFLVVRDGKTIGRRAVANDAILNIDDYLVHFNCAIALFGANQCSEALTEFDAAIALAPTARARFNRGLVLLTLGRWREGFEPYEARLELQMPPLCELVASQGLQRWRGENIRGKKLLLVHDAGFGDTIAMLRYVPLLRDRGADVSLLVPHELQRFASQIVPLHDGAAADYFCPMLSLLYLLEQTTETVPDEPYLTVDPALQQRWRNRIGRAHRPRIGIAWSVGREIAGDYPRAIPIELLAAAVEGSGELFSVQVQATDAALLDIVVSTFEDFADCAALISLMDKIVTVDTAAVHVAGAIGHPDTTVLLSHWASWRWCSNPFYPAINVCQQTVPGDWSGTLAQLPPC
jgi:hypothetical protein